MARFEKARKGFNEDTGDVYFEFANGERETINVNDVPSAILSRVIAHGLLQKIGDSYAGAEDVGDAHDAARETLANIRGGEWKAAREGVGAGGGDLIKALMRVKSATEEKARAVVSAMDAATRKAVREIPAVKVALLQIAAERLAEKVARANAEPADATGLDALGL